MNLYEELERTRTRLLNAVKTANIPTDLKKVLYPQIKRLELRYIYAQFVREGYQDEGFQYLVIDTLKENTLKLCKIGRAELDNYITDVVFEGIPV